MIGIARCSARAPFAFVFMRAGGAPILTVALWPPTLAGA